MRRAFWLALACVAVLASPSRALAQGRAHSPLHQPPQTHSGRAEHVPVPGHCFSFEDRKNCGVGLVRAWNSATFGPATFEVPQPTSVYPRGHQSIGSHAFMPVGPRDSKMPKLDDCVPPKHPTIFALPCVKGPKK